MEDSEEVEEPSVMLLTEREGGRTSGGNSSEDATSDAEI
jgi:hypothetical protein